MNDQQTSNDIRAHVLISGRVQGVSFRWYTQRMAQHLGLTGWVRNLRDGRVEAVLEGPEPRVRQAVAWCYQGEGMAHVTEVDLTYGEATAEFRGFKITW